MNLLQVPESLSPTRRIPLSQVCKASHVSKPLKLREAEDVQRSCTVIIVVIIMLITMIRTIRVVMTIIPITIVATITMCSRLMQFTKRFYLGRANTNTAGVTCKDG